MEEGRTMRSVGMLPFLMPRRTRLSATAFRESISTVANLSSRACASVDGVTDDMRAEKADKYRSVSEAHCSRVLSGDADASSAACGTHAKKKMDMSPCDQDAWSTNAGARSS